MFTKEEASRIRHEFWTTFGRLLAKRMSAEGRRVNWLNYRTGVKHIFFKMDADSKRTYIGIEITHRDEGLQALFFEQFEEMKTYLHGILGEEWIWDEHAYTQLSQRYHRIYTEMKGKNVFLKDQWPEIMEFLRPRILALDEFWCDAKGMFEALED